MKAGKRMYERSIVKTLVKRLQEERRFIQIVEGPRQTGKTTAISQALTHLSNALVHSVQANQTQLSSAEWLRREWQEARRLVKTTEEGAAQTFAAENFAVAKETEKDVILVIDEIQLVDQWSSIVKELWDEDTRKGLPLKVVLSGSSSLLLNKGLTEGLTGRFEIIPCYQWDYAEVKEAFSFSLSDYLFYGGYPGAAPLIKDNNRWLTYMEKTIINPSIFKDVISLDKITKPALMEQLFFLGATYSGQEISWRKIQGQLQDAGNTTTLANYLRLLDDAGLLAGLMKYSQRPFVTRGSSPKLMPFDTSLMTVCYGPHRTDLLKRTELKGRLVESAVGAYLIKRSKRESFSVRWWREGNFEVDFILESGNALSAIEVKSGYAANLEGLDRFSGLNKETREARKIVIGEGGAATTSLEEFLLGQTELF